MIAVALMMNDDFEEVVEYHDHHVLATTEECLDDEVMVEYLGVVCAMGASDLAHRVSCVAMNLVA